MKKIKVVNDTEPKTEIVMVESVNDTEPKTEIVMVEELKEGVDKK